MGIVDLFKFEPDFEIESRLGLLTAEESSKFEIFDETDSRRFSSMS